METRKLELLFGRRKEGYFRSGPRCALGRARLDVRATSDAFAPVVAIRKAHRHEAECPYRYHDGSLWAPWSPQELKGQRGLEEAKSISSTLLWNSCKDHNDRLVVDAFGTKRQAEYAFRAGPDFSEEPAVKAIAWKMDDLLYVDDVLHQRSLGPHYVVTDPYVGIREEGGTYDLTVNACYPFEGRRYASTNSIIFPAHRRREMTDLIDELELRPRFHDDADEGAFLVIDREALDCVDYRNESLVATARLAAHALSGIYLRNARIVDAEVLADLKDALAPLRSHRGFLNFASEDLPAIRAALGRVDAEYMLDVMPEIRKGAIRFGMRMLGLDVVARLDAEALSLGAP